MGTDMSDAAAASLSFPDKETVVGYAHLTFDTAEHALDNIADEEFGVVYRSPHAWAGERIIGMYVVPFMHTTSATSGRSSISAVYGASQEAGEAGLDCHLETLRRVEYLPLMRSGTLPAGSGLAGRVRQPSG
jgi:hypothetical protein